MGKRRKSREIAVQMLYQIEIMEQVPEKGIRIFLNNFPVNDTVVDYAVRLVRCVHANLDDIDATIEKFSRHWKLDRMTAIDRNILRMAASELLFNNDVPKNACINEAIEIARKFSTDDSTGFINGILDAVKKTVETNKKNES